MLLGVVVGADRRVGPPGTGQHTQVRPYKHSNSSFFSEKTEGTPFFMEEIVQELVEQGMLVRDGCRGRPACRPTSTGAHIGAPLHIPTMLGVLAARIDRLDRDEKALLQQLSVIGREFPLNLVSAGCDTGGRGTIPNNFLPPAQRVPLRAAGIS